MKGCFVKQAYSMEYTRRSVRYTNARNVLGEFLHRSQGISLIIQLEADIWVIEGITRIKGGHVAILEKQSKGPLEVLVRSHETVPLAEVPWQEYDVVISDEPIIPYEIIKSYPRILWCYRSLGHTRQSHKRWVRRPAQGYDLFLDHALYSPRNLDKLPQSLAFPYTASVNILPHLVSTKRKSSVFLASRIIPQNRQGFHNLLKKTKRLSGLSAVHVKPLLSYNTVYSHVAKNMLMNTSSYLNLVASCKYFFSVRGRVEIGQASLEAAALGLIVVAGEKSIYGKQLCHPGCLVGNINKGLNRIREIENQAKLQRTILKYQKVHLSSFFWSQPLSKLRQALEIKRAR